MRKDDGLKPRTPHHGFKYRGFRRAQAFLVKQKRTIESESLCGSQPWAESLNETITTPASLSQRRKRTLFLDIDWLIAR